MGSKIVLHTFGSLGDLNPYLGIALGLKSMGHAPVIATGGVYRDYVEGAGVGFHPVRPDVSIGDRDSCPRRICRACNRTVETSLGGACI